MIPALILIVISSTIIFFLTKILYTSFRSLFAFNFFGKRLLKSFETLDQIDQIIKDRRYQEAIKEIRSVFILEDYPPAAVLYKVKDLHSEAISKIIVISDTLLSNISRLPEVDRLIAERIEIQVLYYRTKEAFDKMKDKRQTKGKQIPAWSKNDFDQRIASIQEEIKRNRKELERELSKLLTESITPKVNETTIH